MIRAQANQLSALIILVCFLLFGEFLEKFTGFGRGRYAEFGFEKFLQSFELVNDRRAFSLRGENLHHQTVRVFTIRVDFQNFI